MHLLEEAAWASKRCKTYDMSENAVAPWQNKNGTQTVVLSFFLTHTL